MIDSTDLNPGNECPVDGCTEEIVTVAHQSVDPDELAEGVCYVENENVKEEGIVSLAGNVTVIFHEGPRME
jgi:hypothetical protein